MTQDEFMLWAEYYRKWPFDDLHRVHRPTALLAASKSGATVQEILDWLQPPSYDGFSKADIDIMRAAGVKI